MCVCYVTHIDLCIAAEKILGILPNQRSKIDFDFHNAPLYKAGFTD